MVGKVAKEESKAAAAKFKMDTRLRGRWASKRRSKKGEAS
jgi:hypothetical protein